jgi:hypothetical protein
MNFGQEEDKGVQNKIKKSTGAAEGSQDVAKSQIDKSLYDLIKYVFNIDNMEK